MEVTDQGAAHPGGFHVNPNAVCTRWLGIAGPPPTSLEPEFVRSSTWSQSISVGRSQGCGPRLPTNSRVGSPGHRGWWFAVMVANVRPLLCGLAVERGVVSREQRIAADITSSHSRGAECLGVCGMFKYFGGPATKFLLCLSPLVRTARESSGDVVRTVFRGPFGLLSSRGTVVALQPSP